MQHFFTARTYNENRAAEILEYGTIPVNPKGESDSLYFCNVKEPLFIEPLKRWLRCVAFFTYKHILM